MDIENHSFHLVSGIDHLRRVFHAARPRHFSDVNQTFHARFEFHEGAVVGDVDHTAHHATVDPIAIADAFPGVGRHLFQAQRDALLRAIELQHPDRDFVAGVNDLRRMRHAAV